MADVRKLAAMGHFDASECNKLHELDPVAKCEACKLEKMHRTPNKQPFRAVYRLHLGVYREKQERVQ